LRSTLVGICGILFATGIVVAGTTDTKNPGDLHFKAGIGYDFVSQEYFYDSLAYEDTEAPLTSSLLKKEYLDDKKGLIYIRFDDDNLGRRMFEFGWEQTADLFRIIGDTRLTVGGRRTSVTADARMEIKEQYKGEAGAGEELEVYNGRLSLQRRFGNRLTGKISAFAEKVSFDVLDDFVYNYTRAGGQCDFSLFTKGFNSIFGSLTIERRNVPDSANLDYVMIRSSTGYMGGLGNARLSSDIGVETKNYKAGQDQDDYVLLSLSANLRVPVGPVYFIQPEISIEYFNFRSELFLNEDYSLTRVGLMAGRELDFLTLSVGPEAEILGVKSDLPSDDDYMEYLLSTALDYYSFGQVFVMFENQLGLRTYRNNPEYYSDFSFNRVSLIGNLKIVDGLSLNVLLSADWEWHSVDSDDSRLYLISSGLTVSL